MGSWEQAPGYPLKMLLCQGCGAFPVETGFSPSPRGSHSRSEFGCSYVHLGQRCGRAGSRLNTRLSQLSARATPDRCPHILTSGTQPQAPGGNPRAVQMPEPIRRQSWGRKSSASSTALCRGAHAHPTGSLGPGWGPVSLVSEGACLAALYLQQSSFVEWGMDG